MNRLQPSGPAYIHAYRTTRKLYGRSTETTALHFVLHCSDNAQVSHTSAVLNWERLSSEVRQEVKPSIGCEKWSKTFRGNHSIDREKLYLTKLLSNIEQLSTITSYSNIGAVKYTFFLSSGRAGWKNSCKYRLNGVVGNRNSCCTDTQTFRSTSRKTSC